MHELGIAYYVADAVTETARENKIARVESVTLELGQVSGVVFSYLSDLWPWAVRENELLKDSRLLCEEILAVTVCLDCGRTYGTLEHGRQCPFCESWHTELVTGNEVNIKEIEVEDG